MEFKSYKRIVIVGNGGSSINSKNGTFIDNSDIVVRLKSFVTKDFEDYVGSKTSIWFTKWFSYRKTNIQKIWLPFINPDNFILDDKIKSINAFLFLNQFNDRIVDYLKHKSYITEIGINNIEFLKETELAKCLYDLGINYKLIYTKSGLNVFHPTTYLLAIFLCLQRYPDHKIYITGFDGFDCGYYWNLKENKKDNKTWPHEYTKEKLYIKKLIHTNLIETI